MKALKLLKTANDKQLDLRLASFKNEATLIKMYVSLVEEYAKKALKNASEGYDCIAETNAAYARQYASMLEKYALSRKEQQECTLPSIVPTTNRGADHARFDS